jgi:hypothetical protein
MNRRLICLLSLLPLVPALAFGQSLLNKVPPPAEPAVEDKTPRDPNKLAALSLLGDNVQLLSLSPARGDTVQTGEWTSSPAGGLDNAVLQALNEAVKASGKGREIKLYTSTTRSLFGEPANLFVDGKLSLPGKLGEAVRQSGAARLLLVTRSRQEPALAAALPARILATLEGPGFVLDQRPSAQIGFDGQPGRAVLAPYVSIRVALVDLADLKLKREQSLAVAGRLAVEGDGNPWAATTAEQRVKALEALIDAELPKAVAGLVAN